MTLWGLTASPALVLLMASTARENEYVLTRDLHEWEMDLTIDQQQGQGSTFYVIFRLKASPDMKFNLLQLSSSRPGRVQQ